MNKVRMNLTQRDQRPYATLADGAKLLQKFLPILLDRGAGVLLSESQIQSPPAVSLRKSVPPHAEAMDEPGDRLKRISLQDFALSFPGSLERHRNILAMSSPSATQGLQQIVGVMLRLSCRACRNVPTALRV